MQHTTPADVAAQKRPGLLINRDFGLLWSGQAISIIGDFAFTTAVAVWIYTLVSRQPWAPLAVAAVFLVSSLPMLVVGPVAGVFVDRWDKRRTMLAMDAIRALLVLALLVVTTPVPRELVAWAPWLAALAPGSTLPLEWRLGAIYGVVAGIIACEQFFRPAMMALVGDLVPEAHRGRALGLSQSSVSVAMLLGSLGAPALVVTLGAQWVLLADALSFAVSFLTVRAVRAPQAARSHARGTRGHFGREFAAGVRFFARSRVSMTLLLAGVAIMAAAGAINSLDIFFVTGNLRTDVRLYGVLDAAFGGGMILGSLLAALLAQRLGYGRVVGSMIVGMGALMLVYSRLASFGPAVAVLGSMGICASAMNAATGPLLLAVTPRAMVGRRMAIMNPAIAVASLGGTALAGYLAGTALAGFSATLGGLRFGPVDTIFSGAGLLTLLGGVYCAATLRARVIERERAAKLAAETEGMGVSTAATGVGREPVVV